MSSLSLCTFVKNEAHCLENMLKNISKHILVHEIIVVDTGSTDDTIKIAQGYTNHIYKVGFTDFGSIRTLTAHLATQEWVLMLDADETISISDTTPEIITKLITQPTSFAYAFPRKRWLDLKMKQQTEVDAYPDWQVRLYKNRKDFIWRRELHEEFHGCAVEQVKDGLWINHFQDVFKNEQKNQVRFDLYEKLSTKAGVTLHGGKKI